MKNVNILIVDGRIDLIAPLVEIFERKSYNVTAVEDGGRAIRLLKRKYFDIVVTHPQMPGVNGGLNFRVLKSLSPSMAVIIVNSGDEEKEMTEIVESEIEAVVHKPFNVKKLLDIVESIIEAPSVLIVDYRVEDGEALRNKLVERKCRALVAKDGDEAIEMVRESDFDVLVLDVRMAGKDGMEVLETVKRIKPVIGVVMMIDYSSLRLVGDLIKKGASSYLYKPFLDIERLVKVIKEMQSQKRTYPTPIDSEFPHS